MRLGSKNAKKGKLKQRMRSKNGKKPQKMWVDDEREEGGLQSEGVVQLEGTLRTTETKTKDRS